MGCLWKQALLKELKHKHRKTLLMIHLNGRYTRKSCQMQSKNYNRPSLFFTVHQHTINIQVKYWATIPTILSIVSHCVIDYLIVCCYVYWEVKVCLPYTVIEIVAYVCHLGFHLTSRFGKGHECSIQFNVHFGDAQLSVYSKDHGFNGNWCFF